MISEIFMQINRILTKLRQLKLRGPVIKPHRVICLFVIHSLCNVKWTSVKFNFLGVIYKKIRGDVFVNMVRNEKALSILSYNVCLFIPYNITFMFKFNFCEKLVFLSDD